MFHPTINGASSSFLHRACMNLNGKLTSASSHNNKYLQNIAATSLTDSRIKSKSKARSLSQNIACKNYSTSSTSTKYSKHYFNFLSLTTSSSSYSFDSNHRSIASCRRNYCVHTPRHHIIHKSATPDSSKRTVFSNSLPQVKIPDNEDVLSEVPIGVESFKGLETDFPCLTNVKDAGPEPQYQKVTGGYNVVRTDKPFPLTINKGVLPQLEMAYETWGELNQDASNAVIVLAGLSASSHAKSHPKNEAPGWWEKFVGPGSAVDTNKFFVICPNNLGGCYGSSGPSSINVLTGKPYATTFPIISVEDMSNAIFTLLDHLGIRKLYAAVGSSLGGMLSLQASVSFPDRVGRIISISSCARSHPSSIAMRYLQRKCIMSDPNWNKGHYYDGAYPKIGMKLAREIATITYRSGPEWAQRFGRSRINEDPPSLCPTFSIESYLEHQGESFSTKYDPNSLLYISKAMDLFDLSEGHGSLKEAFKRIMCPVMVIGVQTDILFPIWQQRDLAEELHNSGHPEVTFYELNSIYGHDTFLLDLNGVGAAVKGFLETKQKETGWLTKHKM